MPEHDLVPVAPWVAELCSLVKAKLGYKVPPHRTVRELVPFVVRMANAAGHRTTGSYVAALAAAPTGPDWAALVELLTVGETYFYRHRAQLEAVVAHLAETYASAGRAVRVWSAGCASGEEPLTLAMRLEEEGVPSSILASDVNERVLDRAREASTYSDRSVGHLPERLRGRWLEASGRGRWKVRDPSALSVSYHRHNLVQERPLRHPAGPWDAILCRNVLLYFPPETGQEVVRGLSGTLAPEGALWLAPCDHVKIGNGFPLSWDFLGDERFLRARPRASAPAAPVRPLPAALPVPPTRAPVEQGAQLSPLFERGLIGAARHALEARTRSVPDDGEAWVALAACHLSAHEFDAALVALEQASSVRPKPPGLEYFRGTTRLKTGRTREALDAFHAAVQDDPDDWASSYLLSTLYRRAGRRLSEEAMLELSAELLDVDVPRAPDFGIGAGVVNSVHREPEQTLCAVRERLAELRRSA